MGKRNQNYTGRNEEQHLQSKFPTSVVIPFLPKSGHLGSKLLVIALNAWSAPCGMEGSRQQSIFQSISSPDGMLHCRLGNQDS